MTRKIAIIDGDVLCYYSCEPRWEKKVAYIDDKSVVRLDDKGKRIPLEFTQEEDAKYLEKCLINFRYKVKELLDTLFCSEYLMAVKGPDNFRNLMYPEYKLNRHADPNKQNMFVPFIRELAVIEDFAIASDGREADDLLRIWAEECRIYGIDYIICSIDKDLKCIPGKHWNLKKEALEEISEEDAVRFYYEQLLKGDPTDNIPGVPRVGDVKAKKLLAEYNTEAEFQEVVVEQYLIAYGEDHWKDYLLSNGKMIYLQKHMNDYFTINDWDIVKELS